MGERSKQSRESGRGETARHLRILGEAADLLAAPLELDTILRRAVAVIARAVRARIVSIMILDQRDGCFVLAANRGLPIRLRGSVRIPPDQGVIGWVAKTGEPLLVEDLRTDGRFTESPFAQQYSTTSLLCVPIHREGKVVGAIAVNNKRDGKPFDGDDLAWLVVLARQAALLLEKASLLERVAGERDRWRHINELASTLMGTLAFAPLMRKVLRATCRLLGATHASLLLHDPEENVLRFAPAVGPGADALRDIVVRPGQGLAGWVFANRKSALVGDAGHDERFWPGGDSKTGLTTRTIMAVPLCSRNRALGVMEAVNRVDGGAFSQDDLRYMEMIGAVVSIALDNSLLYRRLTDFNHRLERTVRARTRQIANANRDLARSLRTEENLRRFNDLIIDNQPSGLLALDGAGAITMINAPGLRILQRDDLPPGAGLEHIFTPDQAQRIVDDIRAGALERRGEASIAVAGGEERIVGYSFSSMQGSPDGRSRWIMVFQDLTEAKRFERTVRRLDQLVSLGEISANIAHELRNPLTVIFSFMDIFLEKAPPELRERIEIVIKQLERMEGIIAQMGIPTREVRPSDAAVDLRELLRQLTLFLDKSFRERQVRLAVSLAEEPLWIRGDGDRLQQAFLNILMNGLQATPREGSVVLRAAPDGADRIEVVVCDSGPGIPPGILPRIFEPFFTTKEQGTGLGLAITHGIVREHGGEITASNNVEGGACFRITLPVVARSSRGCSSTAASSPRTS